MMVNSGSCGTSGYEALDFSNNMPDTITGSGWSRKLLIAGWGTTGWANIAKVSGATATDLAKIVGIAVADIAKWNGVDV